LSSLFDIPAQLALVLSLAAGSAEPTPVQPAIAGTGSHHASQLAAAYAAPAGPLLYSEQSWLRALHDNPHAATRLGARVFVTSGGRYYVPAPHERQRILAARNDAALAAPVTRAAAEHNAARMREAFDRTPVAGDLYIAHLFGAETAIGLVRAVGEEPDAPLRNRFPMIAGAISDGSPAGSMTVEQFYLRILGALGEPPRLVAIGLKPTVTKRGRDKQSMERPPPADRVGAWRAEVVNLRSSPATQQH